jgi:TRAP transporter TAXI family solute receptor
MIQKKNIFTIIFVFLSLMWASTSFSQKQIMFGASDSSSGLYTYLITAARIIGQIPNVKVTAVETGGTIDDYKRFRKGDLDLGLIASDTTRDALLGEGSMKGASNPNLRVFWYWSRYPWNIVVTRESGIKTLKDLDGKSFNAGGRGSATEKTMEMMLDFLNIKPKYYRASLGDVIEAMQNRQIVGFVKAGVADSTVQKVAANQPIDLINFDQDLLEKLKKRFPAMMITEIPANTFRGVSYPVRCVGAAAGVGGNSTLDPALVYSIVKSIWENHNKISAAYPQVKSEHTLKLTVEAADIPLHAGTVRYLQEQGIKVPDNLIPQEARK